MRPLPFSYVGVSATPPTQEQYVFIHDAVLEWLTCGDTQIVPTNLRMELARLDTVSPDTNITGYQQQFKVQ